MLTVRRQVANLEHEHVDLLPVRIHPEEELTVLSSFVLQVLVEGVQRAEAATSVSIAP